MKTPSGLRWLGRASNLLGIGGLRGASGAGLRLVRCAGFACLALCAACSTTGGSSEADDPGAVSVRDASPATDEGSDDPLDADDVPDATLGDTETADALETGGDDDEPDAGEVPDVAGDSADDAAADIATDTGDDPSTDVVSDAGEDTAPDTDPDIAADTPADTPSDPPSDTIDTAADAPTCRAWSATPPPEFALPTRVGRHELTSADGFQDDYLYDSAGAIKVGARRDWGGSLIYFGLHRGSPGMDAANTIDANDTGREVQVAFYDPDRIMQGCAHDASCASGGVACPASIRFLGWNPVQGGNRCNVGSGVESVTHEDGVLTISTIPRHWNPDWDRTTCDGDGCGVAGLRGRPSDVRVTQRMRFVTMHVVELDYTLENLSDLDHAATIQELPTLYAANGRGGPDLWRLFDAGGREVAIDTPSGNLDGFMYESFESPGPWATLQNSAAEYGVGLYHENGLSSFQAWQLRSLPFNNFRARFEFGIPPRGVVRARAYLIIGSLGTMRSEAEWLDTHLAPFGSLDAPVAGGVDANMAIRGWALDNREVSAVVARIDEGPEVALSIGGARSDVCRVWPGYPDCDGAGFEGVFNLRSIDPTLACEHLVEVVARDADGNERVLGRRVVNPR